MFRRGIGAVAVAGVLGLTQLGATAADETNRGSAATDLLGATLEVDAGTLGDFVELVDGSLLPASLDVLDVRTYASTDATDRTSRDGPFASAAVVPLRVGADELGAVRADTSGGSESGSSTGGSFGTVADPLSAVGATVAPVVVEAAASAEEASAVVATLLAEVNTLLRTVDLDVEVSQLSSLVDQVHASSGVAIEVSSLEVTLGDLLPVEVLSQLPLSAILDLLEALPVDLTDIQDEIDALQGSVLAVEQQLDAVAEAGDAVAAAAAPFQARVNELEDLAADIDALDPAGDPTGTLTALVDILGRAEALGVTLPPECDGGLLTLVDCVANLDSAVATAIEATLTTAAGDGDGIADEVDALLASVQDLEELLDAVADAAALLGELLAGILDGLLAEGAATELLAIDGFVVGVNATSTGSLSTSHAVVACSPVTARVLGSSHTTPSCSEGLTAVQDVAATIGGAISTVGTVLASLPLADIATVGDLELELFGHLEETVVEDGDYVVATAGVELLDVVIPALTLDPSGLDDMQLGDLALPDVIATVESVVAEAEAVVEELFGDDVIGDDIDDVLTSAAELLVESTGEVAVAFETADQALDDLLSELDGVGTLTSFTTPSFHLVIDPTATAEYATAAAAAPPTDDDDGSGAPLPATGGGLAVLGLLSLGGALLLRKDR